MFMKKKSGVIFGESEGMFPCLWIGMYEKKWVEQKEKKKLNVTKFKKGRFLFNHQYGGHICFHIFLDGIVIPIHTSKNSKLILKFKEFEKKYYNSQLIWASLDKLNKIRTKLKELGPLDCYMNYRDLGEGFFTFDITDKNIKWINNNFEIVTEIIDTKTDEWVKISKTSKLPFQNFDDLLNWFKDDRHFISPFWIKGAFIFENSD